MHINRCGGMNIAQKYRRVTNLPEYLAVHNTGITMTELDHVVQVNRVSTELDIIYGSLQWKISCP